MKSAGDSAGALAGGQCRGYFGPVDPRIAAAAAGAAARRDRGGMAGHGHRGPHRHRRTPRGSRLQGPAPEIGSPGRWPARSRHRPGRRADRAHPGIRAARPGAPAGNLRRGDRPEGQCRNKGYGREALALLTDWLFGHAAAAAVRAPADPADVAMRTVFRDVGWMPAGSLTELGREWVMYRITRREREAWRRQRKPPRP